MTVELAYLLLAGALSVLPTAPTPMVDLPYVAARICEDVADVAGSGAGYKHWWAAWPETN